MRERVIESEGEGERERTKRRRRGRRKKHQIKFTLDKWAAALSLLVT